MNLDDINNLDFENLGTWPLAAQLAISFLVGLLVIGGVYWVDSKKQLEQLEQVRREEQDLRVKFEFRQQQAANLNKYKDQLAELEKSFGSMLKKLPSKTEVPGLLEDISTQGLESGLTFELFDPQDEVGHDFYVELPIKISLSGPYHNLGQFVSRLAGLDRIVTLHDFELRFPNKPSNSPKDEPHKKLPKGSLTLDVTAKTYRYADVSEINENKKSAQKNNKPKR